jgi:hypothetical protein
MRQTLQKPKRPVNAVPDGRLRMTDVHWQLVDVHAGISSSSSYTRFLFAVKYVI